jgi:uncharacterized membrane protein
LTFHGKALFLSPMSESLPLQKPDHFLSKTRTARLISMSWWQPARLRQRLATGNAKTATLVLLFILFALPTCSMLATLVPLGEVPDELAHVVRAASLLNGQVFGQRRVLPGPGGKPVLVAGVFANPALLQAGYSFPGFTAIAQKKLTTPVIQRMRAVAWAKENIYVVAPHTAIYMPLFYLPVACALGSAKLLGFSAYQSIFAARIVNMLGYILLGAFSLGLAKRGQTLLFAALLLPMTLLLAASCNQDGLLIGAIALSIALLTRVTNPRSWEYEFAGALLACVIAVKIPYLPLAMAMTIPFAGDPELQKRQYLNTVLRACFLVALPGVLWAVITIALVSAPLPGPAYHPGPFWPGNPAMVFTSPNTAAQVQVLLHNPHLVLSLPLHAMALNYDRIHWHEMIGVFGALDVPLSSWVYTGWSWALFFAGLGEMLSARAEGNQLARFLPFGIGLLAVGSALLALYDLEYLTWTEVGMNRIDGIQGRYFLPLLACSAAFLPVFRFKKQPMAGIVLTVPAVAMAAIGLFFLPVLVVQTYHLS